MTFAIDAIHPNNNSEYVNIGGQYELRLAGQGSLYLRSGYKSLFMTDSQFGSTYGGGIKINLMSNQVVQLDYSREAFGLLGDLSSYTISIGFNTLIDYKIIFSILFVHWVCEEKCLRKFG